MSVLVIGHPMKRLVEKNITSITQDLKEAEAVKVAEADRIAKKIEVEKATIKKRAEAAAAKAKAKI